jgi:hypothetical protein
MAWSFDSAFADRHHETALVSRCGVTRATDDAG